MNISLACEDSEHALKLLSSHVRPNSDKSFSAANMASILLKLGVELNESFVKVSSLIHFH